MDNKFFTFIKPYLSFIDKGHFYRKPFSWLYTIIAVVNLIVPFLIFFKALDSNVFDAPAKFVFAFLLVWLIIAFASWVSFQLWWDRKTKVSATSTEDDEFIATPVFSHLIQTLGEWFGTWIAIVGSTVALLTTIILGDEASSIDSLLNIPILETGIAAIILMPIYGFLIIVSARFLAEQFRALSTIANNTKKK